ncbi:MAG: hypothetical protein NZ927_09070 [Candidatus Calescibacterium sp.]|nr:hypothetical protein [Candidatus Calescibacterium sp.]MCX7733782.1 hypothetical protein [bacterium]
MLKKHKQRFDQIVKIQEKRKIAISISMYRKVGTFFSVKDKSRKPKRKLEGRRKKTWQQDKDQETLKTL